VSKAPEVGNPLFAHEPSYEMVKFPAPGYQMLALFRWWNIVQYWAPDRDVAGQFWPAVLQEFIPEIALARDKDAYQLALFKLVAKLNDTHANLWSSLEVRPPVGACWLPAQVRWVQNKAVVWRVAAPDDAADAGLKRGDVIEKMDGAAVTALFEKWAPYYADSNQAARMRDMTAFMTRGSCGPVGLDVTRAGKAVHVEAARVQGNGNTPQWHDQPGETFQLLSKDVAYVKLSTIKAEDVPGYFEKAKGTKGIVIDIRNYPSEFIASAMGSMLAVTPTKFVAFTRADLANPGAFWFDAEQVIEPGTPHYGGKVAVLVDEVSQSQAEFTAMALRAMPNTIVVGSTTAGADGNVSEIPLPGGVHTMLSGLGVFYPDRRPTQRVGIMPDVVVTPTIEGIATGRDEVLERAVELIGH
jgi:C-terminal processing protease CtpA/Prc